MHLRVLMISAFMDAYLSAFIFKISCRDWHNSVICLESTGKNKIQEVNYP